MSDSLHYLRVKKVYYPTGLLHQQQAVRLHTALKRPSHAPHRGHLTARNVNEIQRIKLTGDPTGGTFILSLEGNDTPAIAWDATPGDLATAIQSLPTVGGGNLNVTGVPGNWMVEFTGTRKMENIPLMLANAGGLTGGTTPGVEVEVLQSGASMNEFSPFKGGQDDILPDRIEEAHAITPDSSERRQIVQTHTGTIVHPRAPAGAEENTRSLWTKKVFSSRIKF